MYVCCARWGRFRDMFFVTVWSRLEVVIETSTIYRDGTEDAPGQNREAMFLFTMCEVSPDIRGPQFNELRRLIFKTS